MRRRIAGVLLLLAAVHAGRAAEPKAFDWPQYLGKERAGISRETGLLKEWPKEGPRLVWQAAGMGVGYSAPSVAAGRIFTMGDRGKEEFVIALDEATGKELWATAVGPVRKKFGGDYPGPRCTPAVDGERIYALGLHGDLVCLEAATGKEVWRKDLIRDFKGDPAFWGYCESPLVDGDKLVLTPGGESATLLALHKQSGEAIWKAAVPKGGKPGIANPMKAMYSSIIAVDEDGTRQYVTFLKGGVVAVSAADGKFLWRYDKPACRTATCSTPIYHDRQIFAASGYGVGGGLVKLTRQGDGFRAEERYFTNKMKNRHGGMVLVDGFLYGFSEPGLLGCIEFATGKPMWDDRLPGKGAIAYADGRLYYRNEQGPMLLIEANSKAYVEKGRFSPPGRSKKLAWPPPVIANGKLYLRDQDVLLCYAIKQK